MDPEPQASPTAVGRAQEASDAREEPLVVQERDLAAVQRSEGRLKRRLARLQESHEAQLDATDRQRHQIATLKQQLATARDAHLALRSRREVRAVVRLARVAGRSGPVVAWLRGTVGAARQRILGPGPDRHVLRASRGAEAALARGIVASLPPAPPFPRMSITAIVVATTEAAATRLRAALAASGAPELQITVVGAADSLAEAAAGVTTEAVLLVSADVEPIEPTWLARLAGALAETGAAAVGSRLIHARRAGPRLGSLSEPADLTVRHDGVAFAVRAGRPVPALKGAGASPLEPSASQRRPVPALDSCLLVRTELLRRVGGIHPAQRLDVTDPDLSLRLRATGEEIVCVADAVAWHHGPASAPPTPDLLGRLDADWGPRLAREVLEDRLIGRRQWSEEAAIFGVLASGPDADGRGGVPGRPAALAEEVTRSLVALGWTAMPLPRPRTDSAGGRDIRAQQAVDVAVILDPMEDVTSLSRNHVRVACVAGTADAWVGRPWFDDVDVVLVATEDGRAEIARRSTRMPWLVGQVEGTAATVPEHALAPDWGPAIAQRVRDWAAARRFAVVMGADTWEKAPTWGDSYFARALQRQLERRGHPAVVAVTNDSTEPYVVRADAVIHVFGVRAPATRPSQLNILWVISHPHRITRRMCDGYDLLFSASDLFGADLAERLGRPVQSLHQATDVERFRPDPTGPRHEVLFVGNSRHVRRAVLDHLAGTSLDLSVYGGGWTPELLDPRYFKGTWVPNEELGRYYAGAAVVLADHWPDMRDEGFIANRVYDAVAAGAFVVSDDVIGIEEEFDGGVATFRGPEELVAVVERYVADPDARRAAAERARQAVLARHTFGHRADALLAEARPVLTSRPSRIGPPGQGPHAG